MKLCQISDLHLDGSIDLNEYKTMLKKMAEVIIKESDNSNIVYIICCGDIVNKGNNFGYSTSAKYVFDYLKSEIKNKDIDFLKFKDKEEWSKTLFFYLFFALKNRLRQENVSNIGALWDILPADTRMPDHSIWSHCALTSAISSSMSSDSNKEISLSVFSITPVQAFISKARKLRDHWIGSVILSYLSFIGIKYVANKLGPDHIIYPSLQDQSLVEDWLLKDFPLVAKSFLEKINTKSKEIASFPNLFVFISSKDETKNIYEEIKQEINKEWERIGEIVIKYISKKSNLNNIEKFKNLFNYQISDYWQYSYVSSPLLKITDHEKFSKLLNKNKYEKEQKTIEIFNKFFPNNINFKARLYSTTHTLIQSILAASKLKPNKIRNPQNGKKCPICGEHEVLNDFDLTKDFSAKNYNENLKNFWNNMQDTKESEQLCAICSIKRFLPLALKEGQYKNELLYKVVENYTKFPSTTEIAAYGYRKKLKEKGIDIPENFYEEIHELDEEKLNSNKTIQEAKDKNIKYTNKDKYYAILLMDGDRMGDLINRKNIDATWGDVIHPILKEKFKNQNFIPNSPFSVAQNNNLINNKRSLNPSVHATISDSLNSFARFAVYPIVNKYDGTLIYAGGDDVCAIVPLDNAIKIAEEISNAYRMNFVTYTEQEVQKIDKNNINLNNKIGIHLGNGEKISISAAIIIAHHKEPLKYMLKEAHNVLDNIAKEKSNRNSLAIRLNKRSGGSRDWWTKWNKTNIFITDKEETLLESFIKIKESSSNKLVSSSLLYSLENMRILLEPLVKTKKDLEQNIELIVKLFKYEVLHSDKKSDDNDNIARRLAGLTILKSIEEDHESWFNPNSAIIARFMSNSNEGGNK